MPSQMVAYGHSCFYDSPETLRSKWGWLSILGPSRSRLWEPHAFCFSQRSHPARGKLAFHSVLPWGMQGACLGRSHLKSRPGTSECHIYFSLVVLKHHAQKWCREELILVCDSRGIRVQDGGRKHGGGIRKLRAPIFSHQLAVKQREQSGSGPAEAMKPQNKPLVTYSP